MQDNHFSYKNCLACLQHLAYKLINPEKYSSLKLLVTLIWVQNGFCQKQAPDLRPTAQ